MLPCSHAHVRIAEDAPGYGDCPDCDQRLALRSLPSSILYGEVPRGWEPEGEGVGMVAFAVLGTLALAGLFLADWDTANALLLSWTGR